MGGQREEAEDPLRGGAAGDHRDAASDRERLASLTDVGRHKADDLDHRRHGNRGRKRCSFKRPVQPASSPIERTASATTPAAPAQTRLP